MIAKELITTEIPLLQPSDDGNRALEIMNNYLISNLAIVDNNIFKGIISIDDIYNFDILETQLKDFKQPLTQAYIYLNQHIFDAIKSFSIFKTSVLAVLDLDSNFFGLITQNSIINAMSNIISIKEEGFQLKITLNYNNFSATEITNIVEKNDGKVLSLLIDKAKGTEISVYLKISTQEINAVLQSFERYGYDYILLNNKQEDYTELYQERYDNFLHYLNI